MHWLIGRITSNVVNEYKIIMKSIIKAMLAVAAVFTVATASAQPPKGGDRSPEERAKQMSERMAEKLGLDDTQKEQIFDLHKEFMGEQAQRPERRARGERPSEEDMEAMKEARETMMEQRKARMEEMNARIKEILTPEQYEKWVESREKDTRPEGGPHMRDNGRGPHPGAGPEHGPDGRRHRDGKDGVKKESQCSANCDCESKNKKD